MLPATAKPSLEQALAHHLAGRLDAAEQAYRQLLSSNAKDAEAWHGLGIVAHQVGKDAHAVECIRQAINLSPNVSTYHNNLAESYRALGRLDEAIISYRRALQLNPYYVAACRNLGEVLQIQGKREEAAQFLDRASHVQDSPTTAVVGSESPLRDQLIAEGIRDFPRIDSEAAVSACKDALAANPRHVNALVLTSLLDMNKGRLSLAEAALRTALSIDPTCTDALDGLAEIQAIRDGAAAEPYVQAFLRDRQIHMDYPRNIGIETMGHCNATCSFCPQGKLQRKTTKMPDAMFEKIVSDLVRIPPNRPVNIYPLGVNEPLLDPQLIDRLSRINDAVPQATISLYTNFSVLPPRFNQGIWSIRNLILVNVSLNAANPEEYLAVMGLDLDRTIGNIKRFLLENRTHKLLKTPLVLSRVADHTERDEKYIQECHSLFSDFEFGREYEVNVKRRTNWLGGTTDTQSPIPYAMPCGAWLDIMIYCNGIVPLCCMDPDGRYAIGDINRSSILEIYNSHPFKDLREKVAARETVHPCSNCAMLQ